ncbi:MAG: hypothetical protein GC131_04935 [Alphaproteobacteria bacterium]|nr:hypothetical protein [Alphaproteobacteria bacterium]
MNEQELHPPAPQERVSDVLRAIGASIGPSDTVTFGEILTLFGVRGFTLLLLVLALLNIVIIFLPGASFILGIPMIILAAQMALGYKRPLLPGFITRTAVPRARLTSGLDDAVLFVEGLEKYLKPRLSIIAGPQMDRINGIVLLALSCMVAIPIPLFNVPPSVATVGVALGLLARDGVCLLIGYVIGVSCVFMYLMLGTILAIVGDLVRDA